MAPVLEVSSLARSRPRKARPEAHPARAALAVQALQLLGRWQRVSSGHIGLAAGCACGYGVGVDLREIDELILDFLNNRFADAPAVQAFLEKQAFAAQGSAIPRGSLTLLLRALATQSAAMPLPHGHALLQALDGSITSIEEQHR